MKPETPPTLTRKQHKTMLAIQRYVDAHGSSPTMREIAEATGCSSTNAVADMLRVLVRKGWIRRRPMVSRGIVIVHRAGPLPPSTPWQEL